MLLIQLLLNELVSLTHAEFVSSLRNLGFILRRQPLNLGFKCLLVRQLGQQGLILKLVREVLPVFELD